MKTSQLAHDLVTDVAHTLVPDLLLAQQVRDCSEADEEEIDRLRAQNARLVEALELHTGHVWAWSRRLLEPDAGKHAHEQGKMLRDDLRGTRALLAKIDKGVKS